MITTGPFAWILDIMLGGLVVTLIVNGILAAPEDVVWPPGAATLVAYVAMFAVGAGLRRLYVRAWVPDYRPGDKGRRRLTGEIVAGPRLLRSPWTGRDCVAIVAGRYDPSGTYTCLLAEPFAVRTADGSEIWVDASAGFALHADGPRRVLDLSAPQVPEAAEFWNENSRRRSVQQGHPPGEPDHDAATPVYEFVFQPGKTITIVGTFDPVERPEGAGPEAAAVRPRSGGSAFQPLCFSLARPFEIGRLRKRDFKRHHQVVVFGALVFEIGFVPGI